MIGRTSHKTAAMLDQIDEVLAVNPVTQQEANFGLFGAAGLELTGVELDLAMSQDQLPEQRVTGEPSPFVSDGTHNGDPAIAGGYGR